VLLTFSATIYFAQSVNGQQSTFIEGGLEGTAGNSITLANYRAIETAYAREFMRAADSNQPFTSQITYLQQVNANFYLKEGHLV
jgi:hypothetical protein